MTDSCLKQLAQDFDVELFKCFSDPSRLGVLIRLLELGNDKTVGEIAACCPQSLSVVSRHLKQLKNGGVLSAIKEGKEVRYAFENKRLADQLRTLADLIEGCC